jgi:predicted MFS family arabinose efflux permease
MTPAFIAATSLLLQSVPSNDLSYGRLVASLSPLARQHRPISMVIQALMWAYFNAFWVNLVTLLVSGLRHLGSASSGTFVITGVAGAFAGPIGGQYSDRHVIGVTIAIATVDGHKSEVRHLSHVRCRNARKNFIPATPA